MCVIILKSKVQTISEDILQRSADINRDGLGVVWLDDYSITYHKSKEWKVLNTDRPFIAHFRYATVGKVCRSNTHPFQCGTNKNEFLMQNGTIYGMGTKDKADSRVLAEYLGGVPRHKWQHYLETHNSRFVTINTKTKSYQMYNKKDWVKHDGVWYSKGNVLLNNIVAVYGTLRKGNGNYYNYLTDSRHVGEGKTKDKYPLVINGLPYMVEAKGKGYNVTVDVFAVDDLTLKALDRLEGHPNWYERKKIPIKMADGTEVMAWLYFNPKTEYKGQTLHKEYTTPKYTTGYNTKWSKADGGYDYWTRSSRLDSSKPTTPIGYQTDLWDWDDAISSKDKSLSPELQGTLDVEYECITCLYPLMSDGFGNHYCECCDEWYTQNAIDQLYNF
jgi:gamma-glutamylaminecyclotransferase